MWKLSTRRRHRFAGLAVLMLGLVVVGSLYATLAPKSAQAEEASARDIEAGRQLFLIGCASCHGVNAEGIRRNQAETTVPASSASALPRLISRSAPAACRCH